MTYENLLILCDRTTQPPETRISRRTNNIEVCYLSFGCSLHENFLTFESKILDNKNIKVIFKLSIIYFNKYQYNKKFEMKNKKVKKNSSV